MIVLVSSATKDTTLDISDKPNTSNLLRITYSHLMTSELIEVNVDEKVTFTEKKIKNKK